MVTPESKLRIAELSNEYHQTLLGFIGDVNDELTRENIRSKTIDYLTQVRYLAPIDFDSSKIDICPVGSTYDTLDFNPYTKRILYDIHQNIQA